MIAYTTPNEFNIDRVIVGPDNIYVVEDDARSGIDLFAAALCANVYAIFSWVTSRAHAGIS